VSPPAANAGQPPSAPSPARATPHPRAHPAPVGGPSRPRRTRAHVRPKHAASTPVRKVRRCESSPRGVHREPRSSHRRAPCRSADRRSRRRPRPRRDECIHLLRSAEASCPNGMTFPPSQPRAGRRLVTDIATSGSRHVRTLQSGSSIAGHPKRAHSSRDQSAVSRVAWCRCCPGPGRMFGQRGDVLQRTSACLSTSRIRHSGQGRTGVHRWLRCGAPAWEPTGSGSEG
jgi:hypothetical protein